MKFLLIILSVTLSIAPMIQDGQEGNQRAVRGAKAHGAEGNFKNDTFRY